MQRGKGGKDSKPGTPEPGATPPPPKKVRIEFEPVDATDESLRKPLPPDVIVFKPPEDADAAGADAGKDAKGGKDASRKSTAGKDAKGKDAKGKDAKGGKGTPSRNSMSKTPDAEPDAAAEGDGEAFFETAVAKALEFAALYARGAFALADGSGAEEGASPNALEHAVWQQAALCKARVERLSRTCDETCLGLKQRAEAVYSEMSAWIDERTHHELGAVDTVVELVRDAIEAEVPIEADWRLEIGRASCRERG